MVAGYSSTIEYLSTHTILQDGTVAIDLGAQLDASTISDDWVLINAYDNNDYGLIAGSAQNSITGDERAFLLTPTAIPLPPTLWLFGTGLQGLSGVARKKAPR